MAITKRNHQIPNKSRNEKSIVRRVPTEVDKYIEQYGQGDFKYGLRQIIDWHKRLVKQPEQVIFADIDQLATHVKELLPDNHYEHYLNSGLPQLLVAFAKSGRVNSRILTEKRPEKSIDNFSEDDENAATIV